MDYYPFGVVMEDRSYTDLESHRYGFNGMEMDDEVKGEGNSYDFEARNYDSRTGKFSSLDAFNFVMESHSPYSISENDPLNGIDWEGNFKIKNKTTQSDAKSELAILRYTNIVNNLGYLLTVRAIRTEGNSNVSQSVLDFISLSTGLSKFEIMDQFSPGNGPSIEIVDQIEGGFPARNIEEGVIQIDMRALQALGDESISESALADLVLYWGITTLHEYMHDGDRQSNNGLLTGGDDGQPIGKQYYGRALKFGHRGQDMEHIFFGKTMSNNTTPIYNERLKTTTPPGMGYPNMTISKTATGLDDANILDRSRVKSRDVKRSNYAQF
jgi:RHS repeat-associated protein